MFNPHALVEDSKSTVVVLLDPSLPSDASFETIHLPDPYSNEKRLYLLHHQKEPESDSRSSANNTIICEIQAFSSDYASYLVPGETSSLVIGRQSDLWCVTPVDPLFFLLAQCCVAPVVTPTNDDPLGCNTAKSQPWQPFDQLWATNQVLSSSTNDDDYVSLETIWKQAPIQSQALQWYDSMELDPETMVYKFVPQKALDWLVKKQTAVEHVLVRQVSVKTVESGAFSSDFTLSNDLMTQSNIKKKTTV
jgi:hypothetical protein